MNDDVPSPTGLSVDSLGASESGETIGSESSLDSGENTGTEVDQSLEDEKPLEVEKSLDHVTAIVEEGAENVGNSAECKLIDCLPSSPDEVCESHPVGKDHHGGRSSPHEIQLPQTRQLQVTSRKMKKLSAQYHFALKSAKTKHQAIARFVNNRFAGRYGELVDDDSLGAKRALLHPASMLITELIRIAMRTALGSISRKTRKTKRICSCLAAVALAYVHATSENLRLLHMAAATRSESVMHLWLTRHWDETPVRVAFASAAHLLRLCARYWRREVLANSGARWRLVSHDEYTARTGNRMASDTVNLFASRCKPIWTTAFCLEVG